MSRAKNCDQKQPKLPPPISPAEQETHMIALAVDLAERQLRDGSATSQIITHYLKLATEREQLELERIRHENAVLEAKREALESEKRTAELYESALKAMRSYSGTGGNDDESPPQHY